MTTEITRYVVTCSMPGYMPESEPFVLECNPDRAPIPQVLEYVLEEIERCAPDKDGDQVDAWSRCLDGVREDIERAASLDEEGVSYRTPDGYVIEATRRTSAELLADGWTCIQCGHLFEHHWLGTCPDVD